MIDWNPLIIAVAALIAAATPGMVLLLRRDVKNVHSLVNGQRTEMIAELTSLKAQLLALQAVAAGSGLPVTSGPIPLGPVGPVSAPVPKAGFHGLYSR